MSGKESSVSATRAALTLAAFSFLCFLGLAGTFSSLGMVLPIMVKELGWVWSEAGLGYSLLGLTAGLGSMIPAILIRRIGVRATVIVGAGLLAAGFLALAVTHSVYLYLAATASCGLGVAISGNVPATYVLNSLYRKRSTVIGIYFTVGTAGGVAGPLIYRAATDIGGNWRIHWVVFLTAAILAGLLAALVIPHDAGATDRHADENAKGRPMPAAHAPAVEWGLREALSTPQFYLIVFGYTFYLLVHTTAHSFAPAHLLQRGMSSHLIGELVSFEALIGAVMAGVAGLLGERIEPRKLLFVSLFSVALGIVCLAYATDYPLVIVYALGSGTGNGLSSVAAAMLLLNYFGRKANVELYSLLHVISTFAVIGPLLGGVTRDLSGSFTAVFLGCAIVTTLMGAAVVAMRPPVKPAENDAARPFAWGLRRRLARGDA